MSSAVPPSVSLQQLRAFLELADLYHQRGEPTMRDRFLILAADAATAAGQGQEAERLLQRLIQLSPHHLFKAYRTFAEALLAEPVKTYLADLKQNYPPDMVQRLLVSLRDRTVAAEMYPLAQTQPASSPAPPPAGLGDDTAILPPSSPPAPAPAPARRPAPPPAPSSQRRLPRAPSPRPTAPAAPATLRRQETEKPSGGWLAILLFIVVVLVGLALAGYSLVQPFLPPGWLGK